MNLLSFAQLVSFFTAIIFVLCMDVFDYEHIKEIIENTNQNTLNRNNILISKLGRTSNGQQEGFEQNIIIKCTLDYILYVSNILFVWVLFKLNFSTIQTKINQFINNNEWSFLIVSTVSISIDWFIVYVFDCISEMKYSVSMVIFNHTALENSSGFDYWFESICLMHIILFVIFVYNLFIKLKESDSQLKLIEIFSSKIILLLLIIFPVWSFARILMTVSCFYLIRNSTP